MQSVSVLIFGWPSTVRTQHNLKQSKANVIGTTTEVEDCRQQQCARETMTQSSFHTEVMDDDDLRETSLSRYSWIERISNALEYRRGRGKTGSIEARESSCVVSNRENSEFWLVNCGSEAPPGPFQIEFYAYLDNCDMLKALKSSVFGKAADCTNSTHKFYTYFRTIFCTNSMYKILYINSYKIVHSLVSRIIVQFFKQIYTKIHTSEFVRKKCTKKSTKPGSVPGREVIALQ